MANWTLTFGDKVLAISNTSTSKTLIPSSKPFQTRFDDDADFFKPIRTSTGTAGFICKSGDIDEILNASVLKHKVTLFDSTTSEVLWAGFVQQDVFTQQYISGNVEMELPVCDMLEASAGVYPNSPMYMPTIGELLKEFIAAMNMNDIIQSVYITDRTPLYCLHFVVQFRMLFWNIEEDRCEKSWKEIMEETCKAFGWQMQTEGRNMYLFSRDSMNGGMKKVEVSDLTSQYHDGTTYNPSNITLSSNLLCRDHKMSVYQGKSKVTVSGDTGDDSFDLFSINMNEKEPYFSGYIDESNTLYDFACVPASGSKLSMFGSALPSGQWPSRYGLFQARYYKAWGGGYPIGEQDPNDFWGANMGILTKKKSSSAADSPSQEWMDAKGLFICPDSKDERNHIAVTIRTDYIETTDAKHFVSISGIIHQLSQDKLKDLFSGDSLPSTSGSIICRISFAGKYLKYNANPQVFSWEDSPTTITLSFTKEGKILFPHPLDVPRIDPNFTYPDSVFFFLPAASWDQLRIDIYCAKKEYYIIESLDVKVERPKRNYGAESTNKVTLNIPNGCRDDYSVESDLTTARYLQSGTGVILNSSLNPASSIDMTGLSCEESYANRLYDYFKESYIVYEIKTQQHVPIFAKTTVSGKSYAVIATSTNWRTMETSITLIQLKS